MAMMTKDSATQSIVLRVNIDSPNNHQVKTGKMRYDIAKAKKRTDQTDPPNAA